MKFQFGAQPTCAIYWVDVREEIDEKMEFVFSAVPNLDGNVDHPTTGLRKSD